MIYLDFVILIISSVIKLSTSLEILRKKKKKNKSCISLQIKQELILNSIILELLQPIYNNLIFYVANGNKMSEI